MPRISVGCSGFSYGHWKGSFYPDDVPKSKWFEYYARNFRTVELNVTFYRLPPKDTFERWAERAKEGFVFSLKGSRFITHVKRLSEPGEPVERFFSSASALGGRLSAVLWQFPPGFGCDIGRLSLFLRELKGHGVRSAFEFRDASWINEDVEGLLRENGYSFCMADWPPFLNELPLTSDFVYIRRHGRGGRCDSCYTEEELMNDAERIGKYAGLRKDVFVYFNNDAHGYAPRNALRLLEILGGREA